jgi:hypothetical protein
MRLHQDQAQRVAQAIFMEKLERVFCRDLPVFRRMSPEARSGFLGACMYNAESRGLVTEQGIASYILAAWFLDIGFEEKSRYLMALLAGHFPEVRKAYAMNEWVHAIIGEPENIAAADEKLKQAFYRTPALASQK